MRLVAFLIAIAGGFLLNEALPPQVTYSNEILAAFGWGLVLLVSPAPALVPNALRATLPLLAALGIVGLASVASMAIGGQPRSSGLVTVGLLAMAGLLVAHGAATGAKDAGAAFRPFAIAVVVAGVASALIAVVQIFAPSLADDVVIARLVVPGRAVGNFGQPNLLADSLVWALAALVPLTHPADTRARRLALAAVGALLLLGVILSGSRTGLLGIGLLFAWGVVDRKLPVPARRALLAAPFAAALLWGGVELWTQSQHVAADLGSHAGSDLSTSRGRIWSDALSLVAQHPLTGVGWSQFNFAWALTPNPARYVKAVDNAHDLPLQLAVELGVPAAVVVVALLAAGLWLAFRHARMPAGLAGSSVRAALVIVTMIAVHSLVEYPLWYAFFLLPCAWVWGVALGATARTPAAASTAPAAVDGAPGRSWRVVGALFVAASASAWIAYLNIVSLYAPGPDDAPLQVRLRAGQSGLLFSTYADFGVATLAAQPAQVLPEIQRAARVSVHPRLLQAWAMALEARGEDDKARYLAARLRETGDPAAAPFFAPCDDAALAVKPFQCLPPVKSWSWRDFR